MLNKYSLAKLQVFAEPVVEKCFGYKGISEVEFSFEGTVKTVLLINCGPNPDNPDGMIIIGRLYRSANPQETKENHIGKLYIEISGSEDDLVFKTRLDYFKWHDDKNFTVSDESGLNKGKFHIDDQGNTHQLDADENNTENSEDEFEAWLDEKEKELVYLSESKQHDKFLKLLTEIEARVIGSCDLTELQIYKGLAYWEMGMPRDAFNIVSDLADKVDNVNLRLRASSMAISILSRELLTGDPEPGTNDYKILKKYLKIALDSYKIADEEEREKFEHLNNVPELKKIWQLMENDESISGGVKPKTSAKKVGYIIVGGIIGFVLGSITQSFIGSFIGLFIGGYLGSKISKTK